MTLLNFTTVTNAGVDEFHAITPDIDFVFPGADFDAQVNNAVEFMNAIAAGEGDTLQWIEDNLAHLSNGTGTWRMDIFDELFSETDVIALAGDEVFAVNDEAVSTLADTAEYLADFFDEGASSEIADAILNAMAAIAL